MERRLRNIACSLFVCVLVIVGLAGLTWLTQNKETWRRHHDFFAQEEDFDVLFLGSSHMIDTIQPMQLWKDHGIVSYNLAGYRNLMSVNYWMLRNALEHTTPEVVVVDCFDVRNTALKSDLPSFVHLALDSFPLTRTKLSAIWDLYDSAEERFDFLWNFSTYHGRWSELTKEDICFEPGTGKGGEILLRVHEPQKAERLAETEVYEGTTIGFTYLEKIIQCCKERNIELLLVYIPFPASQDDQREANTISGIAAANGVRYENLLFRDIVDHETDSYDFNSHLNISGARKVTAWMGDYLKKNYALEDHRNDPEYVFWHEDYRENCRYKWELLAEQTDLQNYLLMLGDADLQGYVWMAEDAGARLSDVDKRLLEGIGLLEADTQVADGRLQMMHEGSPLMELGDADIAFAAVEKKTGDVVSSRSFVVD